MDAYDFDPGEVRRQKKAGIFKERLRLSGYRTGKTNQLDQKKKGVKKDGGVPSKRKRFMSREKAGKREVFRKEDQARAPRGGENNMRIH